MSSESVYPAGFWKLGMMCASFGRAPPSRARASASTSMPSRSSGIAMMSAPRSRNASSVRSYVGASTTTVSPGETSRSNRNASACIEPLVTMTCSRSRAWRSATQSRRGR